MAVPFGSLNSNPEQLRFRERYGSTIRADFDGGIMSEEYGPRIDCGIDSQIGLTLLIAAAFDDKRHPSYTDHPLADLLALCQYQVCCGYEDGNDSNREQSDPVFFIKVGHNPLDPQDLASGPSFSRLEHAATTKDIYRIAKAFVEQFITSYLLPPEIIVLEMVNSEDKTHGKPQFSFFNG